jgi:hypothetical protein
MQSLSNPIVNTFLPTCPNCQQPAHRCICLPFLTNTARVATEA